MAVKSYESRITSKGQTTIPIEVREALRIGPGDTIQFVFVDGHYEIIPRNRSVESLFGLLKEYAIPNTGLENYREAIGDYFAKEDNQSGNKGEAA